VFLAGETVETFATARGMALVDPTTLITPERYAAWTARRRAFRRRGGEDGAGTVGAVALDAAGHVAAATSTAASAASARAASATPQSSAPGRSPTIAPAPYRNGRRRGYHAGDGRKRRARCSSERHRARARRRSRARGAVARRRTGGLILVDRFGRIAAAHTTPHMTWASRHV